MGVRGKGKGKGRREGKRESGICEKIHESDRIGTIPTGAHSKVALQPYLSATPTLAQ